MTRYKYIGHYKTTVNGNNVRNGEVVDFDESVVVRLNRTEWVEEKEEEKPKTFNKTKKEVDEDG